MRRLLLALALSGFAASAPAGEAARSRAETRLQRAGFELVGEAKRKGDFVILNATRDSIAWLFVIDGRSGEIVGQKPLGLPASIAD